MKYIFQANCLINNKQGGSWKMARKPRMVLPGYPHHVIQRGNRNQNVFFSGDDKKIYLKLLLEKTKRYYLDIWAYCLMNNHIHLIVVPGSKEELTRGIGETHMRYTFMINKRNEWKGHLWQGRF